jgi:hypothetical protein
MHRQKSFTIIPSLKAGTNKPGIIEKLNGREGLASISKRLDRFYISESLVSVDDKIRSWVDSPFLLDHAPIFLQFGTPVVRFSLPFKLNSCWLVEEGFNAIVFVVWNDPIFLRETGI